MGERWRVEGERGYSMTYAEWIAGVPDAIRRDTLWGLEVYREALFLSDLAWRDANTLVEKRWFSLADQLLRAAGSISANLEEGYGRPTQKDKSRFYGIALGSAREARGWYFRTRHVLGPEVTDHRLQLLTQIIRKLVGLMKSSGRHIEEESLDYEVPSSDNTPLPESD